MPCYKCSNGKWKYGQNGNCQFDTKEDCKKAEIAINIQKQQQLQELIKQTKNILNKDKNE